MKSPVYLKAGVYLLLGIKRQPVCPEQRGEDGEGVTGTQGREEMGAGGAASFQGRWEAVGGLEQRSDATRLKM